MTRLVILLLGISITIFTSYPAYANDLETGLDLFEELSYEAAITHLEKALSDESLSKQDRAKAAIHLGIIHVAFGDEEKAISRFEKALNLDLNVSLPMAASPHIREIIENVRSSMVIEAPEEDIEKEPEVRVGPGVEDVNFICPVENPGNVFVNSVRVARCPGQLGLPPGTYQLEVRFDAGGLWAQETTVSIGQPLTLFPSPDEEPEPEIDPEKDPEEDTDEEKEPPLPVDEPVEDEDADEDLAPTEDDAVTVAVEPDDIDPVEPIDDPETADLISDTGMILPADIPDLPETDDTEQTGINWYYPLPSDRKMAWNAHDPWNEWGTSRALSVTFGGFFSTSESPDFYLGLRYDFEGGKTGVHWGGFFESESISLGLSVLTHRAWIIHDFGLPDIQLAALSPAFVLRAGFKNLSIWVADIEDPHVGIEFLVSGLRVMLFDFIAIDMRPQIGWRQIIGDDGWLVFGFSLDTGFVF